MRAHSDPRYQYKPSLLETASAEPPKDRCREAAEYVAGLHELRSTSKRQSLCLAASQNAQAQLTSAG